MIQPARPDEPFADGGVACHRVGDLLWVPLRDRWVDVTHAPEEVVRQEWVRVLVVDGGYSLGQMDQERRTQHGHGSPRADVVVWESQADKSRGARSLIVVETKADDGPLLEGDFRQGASYASAGGARFLIAANAADHAVFQIDPGVPTQQIQINDWPRLSDLSDAQRLRELTRSLRVFVRDEFQRLLADCHDLLRDNHAMTPDKAFDTISKILFIKLRIERTGGHQTFTTEFLNVRERTRLAGDAPVHVTLFERTKAAYGADELFSENETLEISDATFKAIVGKLERFNLSNTSDDVKGIAFEQFLGRTFRGELGQFFTPRPVVDFMVQALDPKEGELICDPAAGSGGFLIRSFDAIRDRITEDIRRLKDEAFARITAHYDEAGLDLTEDQFRARDLEIDEAFATLNDELRATDEDGAPADTRLGRVAWHNIHGIDKEPRAARTAKMNMIMHGDGHGGIHAHDGLIDIGGVWEGRFDIVITNPPFGAKVNNTQLIGSTKEASVPADRAYATQQNARYGDGWKPGHDRIRALTGTPIIDMFDIGRGKGSRPTEVLFIERVLRLLKPGGRAAIVLPNGILNAASLAWLRRWVEGQAYVRGVVALPLETFKFSKASVSASILFLDKFTDADSVRWEQCWSEAEAATKSVFEERRSTTVAKYENIVASGDGDPRLIAINQRLAERGVRRVLPPHARTPSADIERNAGTTTIRSAVWEGSTRGANAADVAAHKTISAERSTQITAAMKSLRADLRQIDDDHTQAMWRHVRQAFDYPVFTAQPTSVGITATGDTGPHVEDDLPSLLDSYRDFRRLHVDQAHQS